MSTRFDVAIVGAGPAGCHAAITARKAGLETIVIDEAAAAGGQVWRQPVASRAKTQLEGAELRRDLRNCGAQLALGSKLWLVERGFKLHLTGNSGQRTIHADRLIVATGTCEHVVPFPGWTLPGVIGLAGATILLKAHATIPGQRTLVAGRGPLLASVASGILELGGDVAAVVDANGAGDWMRALPPLCRRPSDLRKGLEWRFNIKRHHVPWISRSHILEVKTVGDALRASIAGAIEPVECDAIAVGDGLTPAIEAFRLLAADLRYDEHLGGWIPDLDDAGRCSVPGLYASGDGAGVRGAASACESGKLAGLTAALDAGAIDQHSYAQLTRRPRTRLTRTRSAGEAMALLMSPSSDTWLGLPKSTTICRCEDVTRAALEDAIAEGATDLDQLKAWTRCGMGPCQGRMCGEAAARILAHATSRDRATIRPWTARAPIRPVQMDELLGEFDYDDIPIPAAAPL